jgi:hypothetical protein
LHAAQVLKHELLWRMYFRKLLSLRKIKSASDFLALGDKIIPKPIFDTKCHVSKNYKNLLITRHDFIDRWFTQTRNVRVSAGQIITMKLALDSRIEN